MTTRLASCPCGQLRAECSGEPVRISVCHCLNCKRRSGSAFAYQARFPVDAVTMTGEVREWVSAASDSGNIARFSFCPSCGTTVWYRNDTIPETVAVPVGGFADPDFPAPTVSVYEERQCGWVAVLGDAVERYD